MPIPPRIANDILHVALQEGRFLQGLDALACAHADLLEARTDEEAVLPLERCRHSTSQLISSVARRSTHLAGLAQRLQCVDAAGKHLLAQENRLLHRDLQDHLRRFEKGIYAIAFPPANEAPCARDVFLTSGSVPTSTTLKKWQSGPPAGVLTWRQRCFLDVHALIDQVQGLPGWAMQERCMANIDRTLALVRGGNGDGEAGGLLMIAAREMGRLSQMISSASGDLPEGAAQREEFLKLNRTWIRHMRQLQECKPSHPLLARQIKMLRKEAGVVGQQIERIEHQWFLVRFDANSEDLQDMLWERFPLVRLPPSGDAAWPFQGDKEAFDRECAQYEVSLKALTQQKPENLQLDFGRKMMVHRLTTALETLHKNREMVLASHSLGRVLLLHRLLVEQSTQPLLCDPHFRILLERELDQLLAHPGALTENRELQDRVLTNYALRVADLGGGGEQKVVALALAIQDAATPLLRTVLSRFCGLLRCTEHPLSLCRELLARQGAQLLEQLYTALVAAETDVQGQDLLARCLALLDYLDRWSILGNVVDAWQAEDRGGEKLLRILQCKVATVRGIKDQNALIALLRNLVAGVQGGKTPLPIEQLTDLLPKKASRFRKRLQAALLQ